MQDNRILTIIIYAKEYGNKSNTNRSEFLPRSEIMANTSSYIQTLKTTVIKTQWLPQHINLILLIKLNKQTRCTNHLVRSLKVKGSRSNDGHSWYHLKVLGPRNKHSDYEQCICVDQKLRQGQSLWTIRHANLRKHDKYYSNYGHQKDPDMITQVVTLLTQCCKLYCGKTVLIDSMFKGRVGQIAEGSISRLWHTVVHLLYIKLYVNNA